MSTLPWNDGLIHALTGTRIERGTRTVETTCGIELTQQQWDPLFGATGFSSRVTCPDCQPKETSHARHRR